MTDHPECPTCGDPVPTCPCGEPDQQDDIFSYLDRLRESGDTNMFGAVPYLMARYHNMSKKSAKKALADWMRSKEAKAL